jgi:hypothetical protein
MNTEKTLTALPPFAEWVRITVLRIVARKEPPVVFFYLIRKGKSRPHCLNCWEAEIMPMTLHPKERDGGKYLFCPHCKHEHWTLKPPDPPETESHAPAFATADGLGRSRQSRWMRDTFAVFDR